MPHRSSAQTEAVAWNVRRISCCGRPHLAPLREKPLPMAKFLHMTPGRLLIAEDDESLRALLVRYFTSLGHGVEACADGAAAVGRLATGQYDVVITDGLMPGTNGPDVMPAAKATSRHEALSIIMFDLDQFANLNDSYGSAAGDNVLLQFAQICRELLRTEDVLARYWADKFVCLLPVTDIRSAETVAERVCARVASTPLPVGDGTVTLHASAGVASREDSDRSLDTLLRRAERALRRAKDHGGNSVQTEG